MGVGIEWLGKVDAGIVRFGASFQEPPDPYDFTAFLVRTGSLVTIKAGHHVVVANLLRERAELRKQFLEVHITHVEWERHKNFRDKRLIFKIS